MRLEHPIFRGPLEPGIGLVDVDVPENYADYPEGKELGKTLRGWKVHGGEFPDDVDVGLVSDPYGFEDSPDTEWISSGVNSKGPVSMALGREANRFLWGFAGDPDQMTESARRVFVNALVYMAQFDGARPLVRRSQRSREMQPVYVGFLRKYTGEDKIRRLLVSHVCPQAIQACGVEPDKLERWLAANLEYLQCGAIDGPELDDDLAELRVSNRQQAFLDLLVRRLREDAKDEVAGRLARRYLFDLPDEEENVADWIEENRERLFFSDIAGYRWFLDTRTTEASTELVEAKHLELAASAHPAVIRPGEDVEVKVVLRLDDGWHTYSPFAAEGFPARLELRTPEGLVPLGKPVVPPGDGVLAGEASFAWRFRVPDDAATGARTVTGEATVTVCDDVRCLPPQTVAFAATFRVER